MRARRPCPPAHTSARLPSLPASSPEQRVAQRDPLAEYKLEGYQLFVEMMAQIRRNAIYNVYVFDPKKVVDGGKGGGKGAGGGGGGKRKDGEGEEAKAPAAAAASAT